MIDDPTTGTPPPGAPDLARPLRHLLRPLVRLAMRCGITFPILAELLRTLYVEVATRDVLVDRRAQTDSRVSLLTGVHRKEIRRLRELAVDPATVPVAVTLNSQIIARWIGSDQFTGADRRPLDLPRSAQPGDAPSFDALVRSVTTDVRPRAVLDEWLRQGLVRLGPGDAVVLRDMAFIPEPGQEAQLFYFGRNLHDHIAAAAANVAGGAGPRFLDRSLHYDGLTAGSVAVLEAEGRASAQQLLVDLNRRAYALVEAQERDGVERAEASQRINLGLYLYVAGDATASPGDREP